MKAYITLIFRHKTLPGRSPEDIAKGFTLPPDEIYLKAPGYGYMNDNMKEGWFNVNYIENECNLLLKKLLPYKDEYANCDVELRVAIYSDGQANPGFHFNEEATKLLAEFNGTLDLDIYCLNDDDD